MEWPTFSEYRDIFVVERSTTSFLSGSVHRSREGQKDLISVDFIDMKWWYVWWSFFAILDEDKILGEAQADLIMLLQLVMDCFAKIKLRAAIWLNMRKINSAICSTIKKWPEKLASRDSKQWPLSRLKNWPSKMNKEGGKWAERGPWPTSIEREKWPTSSLNIHLANYPLSSPFPADLKYAYFPGRTRSKLEGFVLRTSHCPQDCSFF